MPGPNWIHGISLNPIIPLAEASGTQLLFPADLPLTVYGTSGKQLPPQICQLVHDRIWRYWEEAIVYSSTDDTIPPEVSFGDFCTARLNMDQDLRGKAKALAKHMLSILSDFTATDVKRQSLRHYKVEATLPVLHYGCC